MSINTTLFITIIATTFALATFIIITITTIILLADVYINWFACFMPFYKKNISPSPNRFKHIK